MTYVTGIRILAGSIQGVRSLQTLTSIPAKKESFSEDSDEASDDEDEEPAAKPTTMVEVGAWPRGVLNRCLRSCRSAQPVCLNGEPIREDKSFPYLRITGEF